MSRREWFSCLAKLVYPHHPASAVDAFRAYLPLLADIPDAAFTAQSLEAVARSPRRLALPDFDEVSTALRRWWRDNGPSSNRFPQIAYQPPEKPAPPTPDELDAVSVKLTAWRQEAAAQRSDRIPERETVRPCYLPPDHLIAAYKRQWHEARSDSMARSIAAAALARWGIVMRDEAEPGAAA